MTDVRAFKAPIDSLTMSSSVSVAYRGVRCDISGRNSPYSSHVDVAYGYATEYKVPIIEFDGGHYKLVIVDYPAPSLHESEVQAILSPADWQELLYVEFPAMMLEGLLKSVEEFLPIKLRNRIVGCAIVRRKLEGFTESGEPIFAERPETVSAD